ncbi:MFS transporter [Actinocrispum sp. NPDC049592]|uniref:MFS transporter n=1 Tax=Actinocrispum sp. NPDC049592 TaxID=3154835 RepID=UPI00344A4049
MLTTVRAPRLGSKGWALLLVLCGAIFIEGSDVAMLNVALPSIREDLGMSPAELSGVMSAYVLGYGGFVLLGGRAADMFGRRRMFLLWLVVFLVFSGLGGFAPEGWVLLLARFVTGAAAAFMTPAGLSIITTSFAEGPQRNRALIIYGAAGAGGFSLGLVAGGLLAGIGWRWVFFAPVILSALILVFGTILIPGADRPERARGFDLTGALTIAGSMLLLVFGTVRLEHPANGWVWTTAAFAGGLLLLAAFVRAERRAAVPLVRLGVLRSGALVRANIGALLFMGSFYGFQLIVTLYLQDLHGWSTVETGLAMLIIALDMVLAPTLTPRLVDRFGTTKVILAGLGFAALGYLLFMPATADWPYAAMLPSFISLGLAFSFVYGPITIAATDCIAAREQGLAGGLLNTSTQFGAALGVTLVTIAGQTLNALIVPVIGIALALLVTGSGLKPRREVGERLA